MQELGQGMMHSVLENDKETIEQGKMLEQAINQGLGSFTPDMMFEQLVKNYKQAKELYGERIISYLTGYDEQYVEKNVKIPEFQREIKERIEGGVKSLKKLGLLDQDNILTDKALELAALTLYITELDDIVPKGTFGEYEHKRTSHYGTSQDFKKYKKGDRYKDISIRKSLKQAIRRGHSQFQEDDFIIHQRQAKGQTSIIYAIDASGSMKGKKIQVSKKAGIALAYKAIDNRDKVGLIVFKEDIEEAVEPTQDFGLLLRELAKIKASRQTDFEKTIAKSIELFPKEKSTKHLILLTDALPTVGSEPELKTLAAVAQARQAGITVSLIGMKLDERGEDLARKIVELGDGRLYIVHNVDDLQRIVLQDYDAIV